MKRTAWSAGLSVSGDGTGVVAHAGSAGLRLLADRIGLTGELSMALARRSFVPRHDRGRVLTDVAVMLADGGEAIADIDVLRHQSPLLGSVASAPTVWRTLAGLTTARLGRIDKARARVRRRVWSLLPDGLPASTGRRHRPRRCGGARCGCHHRGGPHGEGIGGTNVQGQLRVSSDRGVVRQHHRNAGRRSCGRGNAGANTTADHIEVLTAAITQIPPSHREQPADPRRRGRRFARSCWTG